MKAFTLVELLLTLVVAALVIGGVLVALINSAYRGVEGAGRWTTEHHLVAGDRIDLNALETLINDSSCEFVVAEEDEQIWGCIALKYLGDRVEFGTFAVHPERHGAGLGSLLLAYAEDRARTRVAAFQVAVVSKNRALIQFYERRGYVYSGDSIAYPVHANVGEPKAPDLCLVVLSKAV